MKKVKASIFRNWVEQYLLFLVILSMENESWSFAVSTSSSSKFNYSDTKQSRSDYFMDLEDIEGDDDIEADYSCPFCSENFDIVGLCLHIEEEHYDEAKKGVCPTCATSIGTDLIEHIALHHENIYRSQNKDRHSDGESESTLLLSRKELLERSLNSFLGSSSSGVSSSSAAVDQLLTSFVCSYSTPADTGSLPFSSSADVLVEEEITDGNMLDRSMKKCSLSEEKQEEQEQRCKLVQSLLFSTILDDDDGL